MSKTNGNYKQSKLTRGQMYKNKNNQNLKTHSRENGSQGNVSQKTKMKK